MNTKLNVTEQNNINTEYKQEKKTKAKLSLLLLVLLIISMVGTTFAWFTMSDFSSVNNMDISIGSGVQLLIAGEDHGDDLSLYSNTLTNEDINAQLDAYDASLADMVLDPLTSADGKVFYTESGVQRDENNRSFLQFDMYLISSEDMWVHLTSTDSKPGMNDGTAVTTSSTGGQADIIRCARISFTDVEEETTVIYEPNKGTAVAGQTTFDLPTPMELSNNTRLFKLTALTPKHVTVRIWIEGEDPECDDDVQRANLQVKLNFEGTDDNNVPLS